MIRNLKRGIAALTLGGLIMSSISGCAAASQEDAKGGDIALEDMDFEYDASSYETGNLNAGSSVHDPSIVTDGEKYYIVGSHMTFAYSDDLRKWTLRGNGYSSTNMIFGDLFKDETGEVFRYTGKRDSVVPTDDGKCHLWAPDIIYNNKTGLYYMYYCTSSTWNASTLGFATSETIDGKYKYGKDLIY